MDIKITFFPEGSEDDAFLWVLECKGIVVCISPRNSLWTAYVAGTTSEARETFIPLAMSVPDEIINRSYGPPTHVINNAIAWIKNKTSLKERNV